MKKHLNFIIIGAAMGIIPGLIITFTLGRWRIGFDWLILVTLAGGIPGSIGGWIGGAISKKNWGAVLGGLVGTILGVLFAAMPS
jgi:hypothetical protein